MSLIAALCAAGLLWALTRGRGGTVFAVFAIFASFLVGAIAR